MFNTFAKYFEIELMRNYFCKNIKTAKNVFLSVKPDKQILLHRKFNPAQRNKNNHSHLKVLQLLRPQYQRQK